MSLIVHFLIYRDLHARMVAPFHIHIDKLAANGFKQMEEKFYDRIQIVMSDHGIHFGAHLESREGQVEHKLPLLKIFVPTKWLEAHPDIEDALTQNMVRSFSSSPPSNM